MLTRWTDMDQSLAWMEELQRGMDRLFSEVGRGRQESPSAVGRGTWPPVNLLDRGNELVLVALVPGLSQDDIQVTCNNELLTLSGERKVPVPEGYSVHRRERGAVQFSRSFSFPCPVDLERVTAGVKHGVLTVTLPKAEEAKPRQITIKAS